MYPGWKIKQVVMPSFVETNNYYYVFIVNWLWHIQPP